VPRLRPDPLHQLPDGPDGKLVDRMRRPRGGPLFLVLTPDELVARIATLVPPPRTHALRCHGLFAPHSKHRARVVPRREPSGAAATQWHGGRPAQAAPACPSCAGRLELIAFINEPKVARKILDHLGLASQAPPLARASAADPETAGEPGPDYTAADPTPEG